MNKWIIINRGLTIVSATLVAGSIATIMWPNRQGISIVTGACGGIISTIVIKKQKDEWLKNKNDILHYQLKEELQSSFQKIEFFIQENEREKQGLANYLIDLKSGLENINSKFQEFEKNVNNSIRTEILQPDHTIHPVTSWLDNKGFEVVDYYRHNSKDKDLNRIAFQLGENYENFSFFHNHLKKSIENPGEKIEFSIKGMYSDKKNQHRNRMISFATNLKQKNLISHFNLRKKSETIELIAMDDHFINKYLEGKWFERYTYQVIKNFLNQEKIRYSSQKSIVLQSSDGKKSELDMLFMIGDQPLWVECKSGYVNKEHFEKYSKYRRKFNIEKERAIVVILGYTQQQISEQNKKWDLTIVNENGVTNAVRKVLDSESSAQEMSNWPPPESI